MKRMYFDLETSQMVVKTFSLWQDSINPSAIIKKPKIICASWKWEGEDENVITAVTIYFTNL